MCGQFAPEWSTRCCWRLRFLRNFRAACERKCSHNYCMEPARKVLQIVRIVMLVSIVCYAFIGERVAQSAAPDRNVYFAITLIAITTVGIIFAVRRLFVLRSEETLVSRARERGGPEPLARGLSCNLRSERVGSAVWIGAADSGFQSL